MAGKIRYLLLTVTLMPAGHYLRGVLLFPKPRADAAPDTSAPLSQLSKP